MHDTSNDIYKVVSDNKNPNNNDIKNLYRNLIDYIKMRLITK